MTQFIQSTPGTIAAAMGYQSQVPQSQYPTGQLGLAGGGIARLPYAGGTIAGGNIQGTPMGDRTGFGLFSKIKKRVKKLIPKEIAPAMMAAAPFLGPIAGPITAGLGSYKTYGKINPMAMAMSLAPHIKTGGYGDWGGGKSIRGLLTGQGKTGSGKGILGNWGNRIDSKIFGRGAQPGVMSTTPWGDKSMTPGTEAIEGFFGTKGKNIGFEDVFKTLTTDKKGDRTLKNVAMILTASTDYADALQRAKDLGMGEGDLPFSNDDEYNRAKAALKGEIPTYATGGRVGRAFGTSIGGEEGDIGFEEEVIEHPGTLDEGDIGIPGQPLTEFEHEGAQAQDQSELMQIAKIVAQLPNPLNPYHVWKIMKMAGVGIMEAIEIVKNKMGGEEVIEEQVTEGEYPDGKFPLPENWPEGPNWKRIPPWKRKPDEERWEPTPATQFNAARGGRARYANGGINNTRTGLQWGSDKGEGLGGEEVEADMRYDGGFMPYGEEPKADDVPARLSKDEFVFTDQAVAGAGDGDIDLGAERLYNVMKSLEQGGRLSEESEGIAAQEMEAMI